MPSIYRFKAGGKTDIDKRLNASRLLMAAGLPNEAGLFLPETDQSSSTQALSLTADYHLAMHAKTMEKKHLSAAWQASSPDLSEQFQRRCASTRGNTAARVLDEYCTTGKRRETTPRRAHAKKKHCAPP